MHLLEDGPEFLGSEMDHEGPCFDPGYIQQVFDETLHALARPPNDLGLATPLYFVERKIEKEISRGEHHTQRIAQVVRHDRNNVLSLHDGSTERLLLLVDLGHIREGQHGSA